MALRKTKKRGGGWNGQKIIVAVVFLGLLAVLGPSLWNIYTKARNNYLSLKRAEASLKKLEEKRDSVAKEIERLKTDRGIEQEVREKFPVVKEGEQVIVIIDGEKDSQGNSGQVQVSSVWSKFLDFLTVKK